MAKHVANEHMYALAARGAQAELRDLLQRARLIIDLFPHLQDSIDEDELPVSFLLRRGRDRAAARAAKATRPTRASRVVR